MSAPQAGQNLKSNPHFGHSSAQASGFSGAPGSPASTHPGQYDATFAAIPAADQGLTASHFSAEDAALAEALHTNCPTRLVPSNTAMTGNDLTAAHLAFHARLSSGASRWSASTKSAPGNASASAPFSTNDVYKPRQREHDPLFPITTTVYLLLILFPFPARDARKPFIPRPPSR